MKTDIYTEICTYIVHVYVHKMVVFRIQDAGAMGLHGVGLCYECHLCRLEVVGTHIMQVRYSGLCCPHDMDGFPYRSISVAHSKTCFLQKNSSSSKQKPSQPQASCIG